MDAILKWMAQEGITQSTLAGWFGKTQPTVNSILHGKTRLRPEDAKILIQKSKKTKSPLTWEKIYGSTERANA